MTKDLDIVIFGASGYSGKYAIYYMHQLGRQKGRNLSWGVAGRSKTKLQNVLQEVEKKVGASLQNIPIIIADIADESSLNAMTSRARAIINCTGPYNLYGEPVVRSCIEHSSNYVDISAESNFNLRIESKYSEKARERGIYLISSCGFDCIPSDLGVVFLEREFGGVVNSVEMYLAVREDDESRSNNEPFINYGTWESIIYNFQHVWETRRLKKELYDEEKLPDCAPKLRSNYLPHRNNIVKNWWILPYFGSDKLVIERTQRYLYRNHGKRPVQAETYYLMKSFWFVLFIIFGGFFYIIFTQFSLTRKLLLRYPSFFSYGYFSRDKVPSEETVDSWWFSMTFYAEGWSSSALNTKGSNEKKPDKAVIAKVQGRNPGYGSTCLALVLAAITVVSEKDKLPPGGGVFSPGAAFAKTSLVEELHQNGLTFEILEERKLV